MGRTACTEPQCLYKGALYYDNRSLVANLSPWRCGFDSGAVSCTVKHKGEELSACEYGNESLGTVKSKEFVV